MENYSLMQKIEKSVSKKIELVDNQPLKYIGRAIFATVLLTFATTIGFLVSEHVQRLLLALLGTGTAQADIAYNISKILFSAIFPWALVLILFMNTELFTSNAMYFSAMIYQKKATWKDAIKVWSLCYLGNLIGAVLTAALLVYSKTFTGEVAVFASHVVEAKLAKLPMIIIVQGIIANMLVNIAVIMNMNLKDDVAKLKAILFVIFIFAFFGSEHVIANFASVALVGLATNFAHITVAAVIKNFVFATIGNILGGMVIGISYAWLNKGEFQYKD